MEAFFAVARGQSLLFLCGLKLPWCFNFGLRVNPRDGMVILGYEIARWNGNFGLRTRDGTVSYAAPNASPTAFLSVRYRVTRASAESLVRVDQNPVAVMGDSSLGYW